MITSLGTLSATFASVCDRQSILTCCSPSPSTSISTAKSSVTESLTRGRIGSSCFDDFVSRAAWTRASMLRSTVSLHGRGAIFGSAGAGKCGPSRSVFGVLTAKETVLSGQEGSWVLIAHDCVLVWLENNTILFVCYWRLMHQIGSELGKSVDKLLGRDI